MSTPPPPKKKKFLSSSPSIESELELRSTPPFFPGSYIDVLSRCVQRNYNTNKAIAKSALGVVFLIFSFDVEMAIYYRYVSVTSYMIVYTGDTE